MFTKDNIEGVIFVYSKNRYEIGKIIGDVCELSSKEQNWFSSDLSISTLLRYLNDGTYKVIPSNKIYECW